MYKCIRRHSTAWLIFQSNIVLETWHAKSRKILWNQNKSSFLTSIVYTRILLVIAVTRLEQLLILRYYINLGYYLLVNCCHNMSETKPTLVKAAMNPIVINLPSIDPKHEKEAILKSFPKKTMICLSVLQIICGFLAFVSQVSSYGQIPSN